MNALQVQRHFVAVMAKHLPPSAASLTVLDLDGVSGRLLAEARQDLRVCHRPAGSLAGAKLNSNACDAVIAYDVALTSELLQAALNALRPGGRLIALMSRGEVDARQPQMLSDNGYVRILVEPALDGLGVLLRGEKRHDTADTMARVRSVSDADADTLDLDTFRGPYLHLLIQQQPNKPAWKLGPQDRIAWRAIAIERGKSQFLLAFSSLPKAVAFMQPAVLAGKISDVNKVGKFTRASASAWQWGALLNPTLEALAGQSFTTVEIDPDTAEAPDE